MLAMLIICTVRVPAGGRAGDTHILRVLTGEMQLEVTQTVNVKHALRIVKDPQERIARVSLSLESCSVFSLFRAIEADRTWLGLRRSWMSLCRRAQV